MKIKIMRMVPLFQTFGLPEISRDLHLPDPGYYPFPLVVGFCYLYLVEGFLRLGTVRM